MRVLLINDYATPTGGAEIMLLSHRDGLRRRGHQVRVFASRAELFPGTSFADATCYGTTTRFQAVSSSFNPSARRELGRVIAEFKPDIAHVTMFLWQLSPLILAPLRPVAAIYQIVTYKPICPTGLKMLPGGTRCHFPAGRACFAQGCLTPQSWAALMIQRRLWWRNRDAFEAMITPSQAMKERLEADGVGPCEVFQNGTERREARPPLTGDPGIAYAGRISSEKGVDTLLRAFKGVASAEPCARLWISGEGPENGAMKELSRSLGIQDRVEFWGTVERRELESRLDHAWVQVVPSKWDEPFGMVAIEGMMRGTVVVASNSGGLRDIVRDGRTGILFPPGDEAALEAALTKLATDRDLCERMGAEGRCVALADYTIDAHVDRILGLYQRVIEKTKKR